jgi:hypothetical protein
MNVKPGNDFYHLLKKQQQKHRAIKSQWGKQLFWLFVIGNLIMTFGFLLLPISECYYMPIFCF